MLTNARSAPSFQSQFSFRRQLQIYLKQNNKAEKETDHRSLRFSVRLPQPWEPSLVLSTTHNFFCLLQTNHCCFCWKSKKHHFLHWWNVSRRALCDSRFLEKLQSRCALVLLFFYGTDNWKQLWPFDFVHLVSEINILVLLSHTGTHTRCSGKVLGRRDDYLCLEVTLLSPKATQT